MKTDYKSTYKIKGRLLSMLLAVVMALGTLITGIPPMTVYAAELEMQLGMPAITLGTDSPSPTLIGFGGKQWNVIGYNGSGVASGSGTMTLLLADGQSFGTTKFDSSGLSNNYSGSTLQGAMYTAYNSLPDKEKGLVMLRDLEGGSADFTQPGYDPDKITGDDVSDAGFWPLSAAEAGLLDSGVRAYSDHWWLRSPGEIWFYAAYVYVKEEGSPVNNYGAPVNDTLELPLRPAFKLNLASVIFTSAAASGKSTDIGILESVSAPITGPVKLTAVDSSLSLSSTDTATRTVKTGDTVNINYTGASTGTDQYVSCLIENDSGTILYYGKLVNCASSNENGTASFTVSLVNGNYTIKLFSEKCNTDNFTDFCSMPVEISMTVDNIPTLTAGTLNRTGDTAAVIGFTTDEEGEAFYTVVNSGAASPGKAEIVSGGTSLGSVSGAVTNKAVSLTAGAKDIYVVVRDATGNISEPLKITAAVYIPSTVIGFGGKEWAVIGYNGSGVASESDTMTLLLANGQDFVLTQFHESSNQYSGSILQSKMDTAYDSLPAKEKGMVILRDLEGGSANFNQPGYDADKIAGSDVLGAGFWPLSVAEASITAHPFNDLWWLRSPGSDNNYTAFADEAGNPYVAGQRFGSGGVDYTFAVRPAFKLNLSSVFFTSDAAGGKSSVTVGSGLADMQTPIGAVKFTVKDVSQTLNVTADETQATQTGSTLTFGYTNATVGTNQYVSCVLLDGNSSVSYYGKLKDSSAEASGNLSIPLTGVSDGTYTLQIFSEGANGDNHTDFCSEPISMTLNVSCGVGTVSNFGGTVLTTIADVDTYDEFIAAVADTGFTTINVIDSFALEADVTVERAVTITSTSDSGCTINAETYFLKVGSEATAADVSLSGNLTVTGSGTVITVGTDSEFTLAGGTVLASGDNSRGIFVQPNGVAYINGGSVSASGENAYGILLGWGEGMANLYIDMSNTPSIDEIYFVDYEGIAIISFLKSFPAPFSAMLGETTTVTLTGVGDGADFQVHTIWAAPPPGTSVELDAHEDSDSDNTFTITPKAVGTYSLVLSGITARSNILITIPVTVTSGFAGGNGTAGDPFRIANIEQLNLVRKFLGSAHTDKYFMLTENIDLNVAPYKEGEGWEPIGDSDIDTNKMFQGNFDGNGKTISGMFINRTDGSVGLFGACYGASIQNLCLFGVNITGDGDAGSLAGNLYGTSTVTNCCATGTVTGTGGTAGGLVGTIGDSTIINSSYAICSVTGNIAGGLVGGMGGASSITDSYAAGSVTGTYAVGGLVGDMCVESTITNSYAAGTVTGTETGTYAGGLVGENIGDGLVTASYYNSQTSGQSDNDGRGEPRTSNQLVKRVTFDGWNFTQGTGIWDISEGVTYPYLQALVPDPLPAPPAVNSARIVGDAGDSRYNASTNTLTMIYGDVDAYLSFTDVTPAGGLVIWSNSNTAIVDIDEYGDGKISVKAVSVGTVTISLKSSSENTLDSITVIVEHKPLAVTGDFEVEDKEYDGSTDAVISATSTLLLDTTGCIGGDAANLTANFVATFSDPDADQNKPVSLSNSYLMGSAAGNYILDFSDVPDITGTITPKELTIGGSFTAQDKAYDGTTNAAISSNNLTLIGRVGSDDVTLVPVLAFDNPDIGTGKTVSLMEGSYLTGAKAGNYTLSLTGAPTYTSGMITNKQVTIGGYFTINNKEYSGDKTATIAANNLTLDGLDSGDDVFIASVTAEFDSADVGNGKTVRIVSLTLTGANAGNYAASLDGAPTATANITAKPLTITGSFTVKDRQYDGTINAEIDTNTLALDGIIGSDTVTLNASAAFDNANAGTGKTVTLTGSTLTGADAANYVLDFTGAPTTTANIIKATGLQAPAAPELLSKTDTSVTLKPNAEQEFSKDNGTTWQTSNVFTGLNPSTEYSFITRIKEDANHEVSPASMALLVKTDASSSTGSGGGGSSSGSGSGSSGGSRGTSSTGRLEIPSSFISDPNSGKTLTLENDFASVTIPSDMLDNIPGIAGKKAEISIGQGDKSGLPDDVKAAIGDRPLISLSLHLDGKQTEWNNPDAPVTVSIPYTPAADELRNPDGIVVWYIDGSGNPQCVTNGHYDPVTGTVKFDVTHFSDYAVVYNPVGFNDVKSGAWYYKAVSFIAARSITGGTGSGKFSPNAYLTRGDFLVMLMKAYGIAPDTNPADNFSDAGNTYYTGYLAAAKRLGISAGVGNNMYAPGKEITRQEMFTLLYNALKVIGRLPGTNGDSGKKLSDFTDAGQIAPWAKEAMTLLVETGTISGSAGRLSPKNTTTRAELAQVLYNLLSK